MVLRGPESEDNMTKKELKKMIKERLEYCDFGKIVDWKIWNYTIKPHDVKLILCDVITIQNHVVTKICYTYDVNNEDLQVVDVITY